MRSDSAMSGRGQGPKNPAAGLKLEVLRGRYSLQEKAG